MVKIIFRVVTLTLLVFFCSCLNNFAQSRFRVDKSTDYLSLVPATTGLVVAICEKDYVGLKQLALSGATSIAANYLLELSIKKDRPDGSGSHAFPSTHAAVAFTGAAFLQRRYGWKWGAPAYILSTYVGWGRVFAKKHDIWDVLVGAAIGAGTSYVYTRPLAKKNRLSIAPIATKKGPGIYISANF